MLNFEIKILDNKKYALVEGYKRPRCILKDLNGAEYFYVPNYYNANKDEKVFSKYSFNRRIYDAIRVVMDGNGDAISFTGQNIHVQYYLNRSVGDEYRKRTIEGFKNCTLKYEVVYEDNGNYIHINEDNTPRLFTDNDNRYKQILKFDTIEEAQKYLDNIFKIAYDIATIIFDFQKENPNRDLNEVLSIAEIEIKKHTLSFIINMLFWDMFDNDMNPSNDYTNKQPSNLKIWQII